MPPLNPPTLTPFLLALVPLASAEPNLFRPHLHSLLAFLPPLILSHTQPEAPNPTMGSPDPSSAMFGLQKSKVGSSAAENREDTRHAALELMVTLTESTPKGVQACQGWSETLIRCCLEGLAEIHDDEDGDWLDKDVSSYEQTTFRIFKLNAPSSQRKRRITTTDILESMKKAWIGWRAH